MSVLDTTLPGVLTTDLLDRTIGVRSTVTSMKHRPLCASQEFQMDVPSDIDFECNIFCLINEDSHGRDKLHLSDSFFVMLIDKSRAIHSLTNIHNIELLQYVSLSGREQIRNQRFYHWLISVPCMQISRQLLR